MFSGSFPSVEHLLYKNCTKLDELYKATEHAVLCGAMRWHPVQNLTYWETPMMMPS